MKHILTIAAKELRDTIRDRRTLFVMLVLPIALMPLMFIGLDALIKWQTQNDKQVTFSVALKGNAPQLEAALRAQKKIQIKHMSDPKKAVKKEAAEIGLIVAPGFSANLRRGLPGKVTLVTNDANQQSAARAAKVMSTIEAVNKKIVARRLAAQHIDLRVLQPIAVKTQNVATDEEMGGLILSFLLPMILIIWAIMGGFYAAIDSSAGEKERQTLESLLLTPAKRSEIVFGKFLGVFIVSSTTLVLATGSLYFTLQRFPLLAPEDMGGGATSATTISLAPGIALLILGVALLVAAISSAIMLAIGIFAKNFKEGQNYLTPLTFVAMLPMMLTQMVPTTNFSWRLMLIPFFNATIVFKELVMGKVNWLHLGLTVGTSALLAAAALAAATFIFSRERVMFRQ